LKLLLDEQISGKVAERLRGRGHDVIAVTDEPDLRGMLDPDLFEIAQEQRRALVTYNRPDFEPIVREWARLNRSHSRRELRRLVAARLAAGDRGAQRSSSSELTSRSKGSSAERRRR
jgi:hypothetical protein